GISRHASEGTLSFQGLTSRAPAWPGSGKLGRMKRSIHCAPALLLLGACVSPTTQTASAAVKEDPPVPKPAPKRPLTTPVSLEERRGLGGPSGTISLETYRKRRRALMDAIGTGAALVTQEMNWGSSRSGMDYYYLTGIDEPGGGLIVAPTWKPWPEQLF